MRFPAQSQVDGELVRQPPVVLHVGAPVGSARADGIGPDDVGRIGFAQQERGEERRQVHLLRGQFRIHVDTVRPIRLEAAGEAAVVGGAADFGEHQLRSLDRSLGFHVIDGNGRADGQRQTLDGGFHRPALGRPRVPPFGDVVRDVSQRSHVYAPAQPQDSLQTRLLDDLIHKAFAGSGKDLVMAALRSGSVSDAEREEIQRFLEDTRDV